MATGAAWMVLLRISDRTIGLISTVVLARLLMPGDFGLIAIAAAVIGMLGTIGGSDPEAAFAWAAQIGNADKREAGYAEVIQSLHQKSPEAAKSALETAPLSETRKAKLREEWK